MRKFEELTRSELEQRKIELRQGEWEIEAERQEIILELKRRQFDQPISSGIAPSDAYFLDLPVEMSGASTRLVCALINLGCRTLREAEELKQWEISEFHGVGATTMRELRSLLTGDPPKFTATQERAVKALELYQSGKSLAEVSELLDVSVARAGQLTHEGWRFRQRAELLRKLEKNASILGGDADA